MSSALDGLVGVIPVVLVGGLAMKITEKTFGDTRPPRRRRPQRRAARRSRGGTPSFGNFRNVGL